MAWDWGHSPEAYDDAEKNFYDLPEDELIVIASEWLATYRDEESPHVLNFDLERAVKAEKRLRKNFATGRHGFISGTSKGIPLMRGIRSDNLYMNLFGTQLAILPLVTTADSIRGYVLTVATLYLFQEARSN